MTSKVVIQSVEEISIELRQYDLCISQRRPMGDPDGSVYVPLDRVKTLTDAMLQMLADGK